MRSGKEADILEFGNKLEGINYIDRPGAYAAIENKDKQIAVIQTGKGTFCQEAGWIPARRKSMP